MASGSAGAVFLLDVGKHRTLLSGLTDLFELLGVRQSNYGLPLHMQPFV